MMISSVATPEPQFVLQALQNRHLSNRSCTPGVSSISPSSTASSIRTLLRAVRFSAFSAMATGQIVRQAPQRLHFTISFSRSLQLASVFTDKPPFG